MKKDDIKNEHDKYDEKVKDNKLIIGLVLLALACIFVTVMFADFVTTNGEQLESIFPELMKSH